MLSKKLFQLVHKIALFAIVFAALAPSISHALMAQNNLGIFLQEVCSSNGQRITIQVITTKGQQISAEFAVNKPVESQPRNMSMHLEHCPFCANASTTATILTSQPPIFSILKPLSKPQVADLTVLKIQFFKLTPPAQAPPSSI